MSALKARQRQGFLLRNSIVTPDGTELNSRHTHDYAEYKDANGETYILDGGLSYVRMSINSEKPSYQFCYDTDSFSKIRELFQWGTRGKDGGQPLTYKALKDLTEGHIKAILDTQQLPSYMRDVFEAELNWRKDA